MGILLGLAPFIVFFVLTRFTTAAVSLWAAAGASAVLVVRERFRGRSIKILEAGTFVLFALLGFYSWLTQASWDIPIVRTVVDSGLLLIMVISLVVRRPFTLQYAREEVSVDIRQSPTFVRTNYVISAAWAVAMAIVDLADLGMHFLPGLPTRLEVGAICDCARRGSVVHQMVSAANKIAPKPFREERAFVTTAEFL
jgi:hypothetical protein